MKNVIAFISGFVTWFIVSFAIVCLARCIWDSCTHKSQITEQQSCVMDTIYDTLLYRVPVAHDSVVVRYINKFVIVKDKVSDSSSANVGDTASVEIPITQKRYQDSTYTAWVSGYEANLDSINVYQKTCTKTIFQPTYIKEKQKRWGLGAHVGAGITTNKIQPYIGIGVSYNFLTW